MTPVPDKANGALTDLDDERLATVLHEGRHDALTVLFNRHSKSVFRVCRRLLRDDGEAEETVQEVFMDVYRRISQFDPEKSSFRTWLMRIARFRAIDRKRHLQSSGVYRWVDIPDAALSTNHSNNHLGRFSPLELTYFVDQLLAVLSSKERQVIHLHLFRDLTLEETHEQLKSPLSAVRHLYYGAMKKLRAALVTESPTLPGDSSQSRKAGRNDNA
jgi:RNA polymerase sigma-70 factor (ECF subfamily)